MNGLFGINGLTGFVVAVVFILAVVFGLGDMAIKIQKSQATNYYKIENQGGIKMKSTANEKHYELLGAQPAPAQPQTDKEQ